MSISPSQLEPRLISCDPQALFDHLDLDHPGLEALREPRGRGDLDAALALLLEHFRRRFPPSTTPSPQDPAIDEADQICQGIFHTKTFGPVQCPLRMDWARLPNGNVSEALNLTRFYWARTLAKAYQATGEPRYVERFMALADSFFADWPLTTSDPSHLPSASPIRWGWVDLQVARRVRHLVEALKMTAHAPAMTPQFLGRLLGWIIDHQLAAMHRQKPDDGNMSVSQQDGFSEVAATFPELRQSRHWLAFAIDRVAEAVLAQTTPDGLQTEWTPSYHGNVAGGALNVIQRAKDAGVPLPPGLAARVAGMWRCTLFMTGPDGLLPNFGDTKNAQAPGQDAFARAGMVLDDPLLTHYAARQYDKLPHPSTHRGQAAFCVLRDQWGPGATAMMLHCPPHTGRWHDEPDNATFELFLAGRRVMIDTGYFTYGHDGPRRQWHQQTRVHQTLTLDDADSAIAGKLLAFSPDMLCVENDAYPGLTHRRTAWLIEGQWFVILDEAIGSAACRPDADIRTHYQFPPGPVTVDLAHRLAWSAGLSLQVLGSADVTLTTEEGWHAHQFAARQPRVALSLAHRGEGPAWFLVALRPGVDASHRPADLRLHDIHGLRPGDEKVHLTLELAGRRLSLHRAIASSTP